METLQNLGRQVDTTTSLQSVVRTMKALAAVSIRQYQRAAEALEDYHRAVELGLQAWLRQPAGRALSARPAAGENLGLVVFGSDQGMCGQLNEQITRHALAALDDHPSPPGQRRVLAVGLRAAARLEESGLSVERVFETPESAGGITDQARNLLVRLGGWQATDRVEEIRIAYCRHRSGAAYEPTSERLLPLDRRWLEELRRREWPTRQLPLVTMDGDRLFSDLVAEYLFVSLHRAFAESLASEHASRLASMQGAERNIEERLRELTLRFNQRRQIAITEELLDINSGFEALQKPD